MPTWGWVLVGVGVGLAIAPAALYGIAIVDYLRNGARGPGS